MNRSSSPSSSYPLDVVAAILEQENLDCVVLEQGVALKTAMSLDDDTSWGSTIEIAPLSDEIQALVVFSRPPEPLPEAGHLVDTLKLINRINANLMAVGNFEIDLDDGSIRFKSSVDYENVGLTPELVRNVFAPAAFTMDRYLQGLLAVMFGNTDPAEIIEAIESDAADIVG